MNGRIELPVTMELLSDTIFSSGYSIPGGEDISVYRDANGYPYLKGSSLKGLLRESVENWLSWTKESEQTGEEIFGASGLAENFGERRLHFTSLTLIKAPQSQDNCFVTRYFTSLEDGIAKSGSLHSALCIRRGLCFSGTITCAQRDQQLIKNALKCIKWVGTSRNRGFGRVRFDVGEASEFKFGFQLEQPGTAIHYRLHTELPILIRNLSCSQKNFYETRDYIPGGTIRGMVIEALIAQNPEWVESHKKELLEKIRFLNAVPNPGHLNVVPTPQGFFEDREETRLETDVKTGEISPDLKQAKLGSFCAFDGKKLRYWNARINGAVRIKCGGDITKDKEDTYKFYTNYLESEQDFDGYILSDFPELLEKIAQAMPKIVWLGADRYSGFGRCHVTSLEPAEKNSLGWMEAYGYHLEHKPGHTLYMLAMSPFTMLNDFGEPCGLDEQKLAEKLGVNKAKIKFCKTSVSEYGAYNRTWKCREPSIRMYDPGSLFHIECDQAPELEAVQMVETQGIGIQTAEGFGQVLFLREDLFESLSVKERFHIDTENDTLQENAQYKWIMEHAEEIISIQKKDELSSSQLGTIQALCEEAIKDKKGLENLWSYLDKNRTERGARHGQKFDAIEKFLRSVLETPLCQTLGTEEKQQPDSISDRMKLLCQLFNYCRKQKEGGM